MKNFLRRGGIGNKTWNLRPPWQARTSTLGEPTANVFTRIIEPAVHDLQTGWSIVQEQMAHTKLGGETHGQLSQQLHCHRKMIFSVNARVVGKRCNHPTLHSIRRSALTEWITLAVRVQQTTNHRGSFGKIARQMPGEGVGDLQPALLHFERLEISTGISVPFFQRKTWNLTSKKPPECRDHFAIENVFEWLHAGEIGALHPATQAHEICFTKYDWQFLQVLLE